MLFRTNAKENLLRSILPASIIPKMINGENPIDKYENVTIIFADMVGFTKWSADNQPSEVAEMLVDVFSRFDALVTRSEAEKIKTIGDAYMIAIGTPNTVEDTATVGVDLAMDMRDAMRRYADFSGTPLHIRIGIHCGPVVAGVIGTSRLSFDIWGDAVNVASRIESTGISDSICVSQQVKDNLKGEYIWGETRTIHAKGKGELVSHELLDPQIKGEGE